MVRPTVAHSIFFFFFPISLVFSALLTLFRYVLSPTHLHEFKSADRIASQTPVMSLYLPEQKLGSRSQPDSTSHKFMLKGRQTGAMHRGHAWVFRAESYDTMMAWFDDIANLIGRTGEARNAFVRRHVRTLSGNSFRESSISSDGVMDEDEADKTPYSSQSAVLRRAPSGAAVAPAERPQPGGRFPSDVQIDRNLQATLSRSSGESIGDREALAGAGSGIPFYPSQPTSQDPNDSTQHQLPYRSNNEHGTYAGEWIAASSPSDRNPSRTQEHVSELSNQQESQPASPSYAPIIVNNEAQHTEQGNANVDPNSANSPAPIVYAGVGPTITDASELQRQESQRSRQTHSTYSLSASTPTTMTSPTSESNAATRPEAKSKESASTIDLLNMPGKYPPAMAG